MKKTLIALMLIAFTTSVCLADPPAPITITVDSKVSSVPPIEIYQANTRTVRAYYKDGGVNMNLTNCQPYMVWYTNRAAASMGTSTWVFAGASTNGIVDFTFAPSDINTNGTFVYEIGLKDAATNTMTVRQGTLTLTRSPYATGAGAVSWYTPFDWALHTFSNSGSTNLYFLRDDFTWQPASGSGIGDMTKLEYDTVGSAKQVVFTNNPALTNERTPTAASLANYLTTISALNGTNITDGTISSNKLDAATKALLGSGGEPLFTAWLPTNTYVKAESDPLSLHTTGGSMNHNGISSVGSISGGNLVDGGITVNSAGNESGIECAGGTTGLTLWGNSASNPATLNDGLFTARAFSGDGASVTNVNASLLGGYSAEQLTAIGATYYIWGSLSGDFTNPASKLAKLDAPIAMGIWTSSVPSTTNGMWLGYACLKTNETPRYLAQQNVTISLNARRGGGGGAARTIQAYIDVYESNSATRVAHFVGETKAVTTSITAIPFIVPITNQVLIADNNRLIVAYFRAISGWSTDSLDVYSQDGYLTYVALASAGSGVYVVQEEYDKDKPTFATTNQLNNVSNTLAGANNASSNRTEAVNTVATNSVQTTEPTRPVFIGKLKANLPTETNDVATLQYINGRFPSISTAQVSVAQVVDTNNYSRWYKSQSANDAYWANKVVVPTVTSYGIGAGGGSNSSTYITPNGYTSFTMCCWFNPTSNPPTHVGGILTARGSGYMTMRQSYTNHLRVDINNAQSIYSNAFPTTGQWYHIAVTWDNASTNIDVFVNGIKNTSQVNGAGGTTVNNTSLVVGWDNYDPSWYVNAKIDEICMWTRKLTDAEIADVANQRYVQTSSTYPSTGRSMGLNILQILHCDDNTGTTLTDSSGLANNGDLVTASWVSGKALAAGVTESTIISSSDGQIASEKGIHTFGDTSGRHVIEGKSTRFNIGGAEQMRLDSGVLTPTVSGVFNFGDATHWIDKVYAQAFYTNGAALNFGTGSVSPADCTNIAQTVVAASLAPTYYVTNTIVVTNSQDFAIPLAGNNVRVRWMAMFLSATNEATVSNRATFAMFTRPDRLCDSAIYSDTNQLYWAAPSTSAQAAGATTGTVADASGVVLYDRYAVGNGTQWDFLTATNANATTIFWGCTNKYATTGTATTKISHANYLTPVFYDDDSGTSNAWCRFAWTTGHTGTVTTIMRYSK